MHVHDYSAEVGRLTCVDVNRNVPGVKCYVARSAPPIDHPESGLGGAVRLG
jgi:hypothetical protein